MELVYVTDCDGTLFDTEKVKARTFAALAKGLWGLDEAKTMEHWIVNAGIGRRNKINDLMSKHNLPALTDSEYESVNSEMRARMAGEYKSCPKYPGVIDTLNFVYENFDVVAAFTGTPSGEMLAALNATDLSGYFASIYGTGMHPTLKRDFPDKTSQMQHIVDTYRPDFMVVVGDAEEDMRVGSKFKAYTIGLPTTRDADRLIAAGAKQVVQPGQLKDVIEKVLQERQ
jgi:phosphoglycolate phosphatase-like HAD superfamily hydrolase